MLAFSLAAMFLTFYGAVTYALILIFDAFFIPPMTAPLWGLLVMLVQALIFPELLFSIIRPALSKEEAPERAQVEGAKTLLLKTECPVIFTISGLFTGARIVVSQKLTELLSEEEMDWLLRREAERAKSGMNLVFMSAGLIPFVLKNLSDLIRKLGARNRAFGGSESVMSFGGMLGLAAKFLYMFLHIASRECTSRLDGEGGEVLASTLGKVCRPGLYQDKGMRNLAESIDFLCFSSPSDDMGEDASYMDTVWSSRYLMFRSHVPPAVRAGAVRGTRDRSGLMLCAVEATLAYSAFLTFALMTFGVNTGAPLIIAAASMTAIHLAQRPLTGKRVSSAEGMAISPLAGRRFAASGELGYRDGYTLGGIPMRFHEPAPVTLPDPGKSDAQVTGWIRRSDVTYIEVSSVTINGRQAYRSSHWLWYMAADFALLIAGLILVTS